MQSGAWWFYYKLGFRPRARACAAIVAGEVARLARDRVVPDAGRDAGAPGAVSGLPVAPQDRPPGQAIEALRLDRIGLAVTRHVAGRFGADRERAAHVCADEAGTLLGVGDWRRLPKGERAAWMRWGPLVAVLPGIGDWGDEQREALAAVIRAKGGRRETDFVRLFDAHPRLRAAVVALSRGRAARTRT